MAPLHEARNKIMRHCECKVCPFYVLVNITMSEIKTRIIQFTVKDNKTRRKQWDEFKTNKNVWFKITRPSLRHIQYNSKQAI
jgi:hypothetical protein